MIWLFNHQLLNRKLIHEKGEIFIKQAYLIIVCIDLIVKRVIVTQILLWQF